MRVEPECIFCRIASGELPSSRVYEDEHVVAFSDIHPQAPLHVLVVPREHITSLAEMADSDAAVAAAMMVAARKVAELTGATRQGYRVVTNVGAWGGQTVSHLHLHVLGGRQLGALG